MALPQLTPEQRAAALKKAAQTRRIHTELKDELKRGATGLPEVLKQADENEIIDKMRISTLLETLPKIDEVKVQDIMNNLEIAQARRLRGLGGRQRRTLLGRFGCAAED